MIPAIPPGCFSLGEMIIIGLVLIAGVISAVRK